MGEINFGSYFITKFIVYSVWLYFGFRFFRASVDWGMMEAVGLGFLRLCLGLVAAIISLIFAALLSVFLQNLASLRRTYSVSKCAT